MDSKKIGKLIKDIRNNNHLTQKQFASKYKVTYQAVSKWENGINLPDIALIKKICKDYNYNIESFLEGDNSKIEFTNKKVLNIFVVIIIILLILSVVLLFLKNSKSFEFKTISTSCDEFKVSGSIAYNKEKSSIYISHIDYCGGDNDVVYKRIECNLFENNKNVYTIISSCKERNNIKLEDYLKEAELNADNYSQKCKTYDQNSLYLEINAVDYNNIITTYKIPLNINKNCPK